ncbi:MAG: methionine gamma-lyase family protein, partial [Clostridia bacterium]|nr:methionine gamma-lyase family protein [Clostridia bacterium]
MKAEELIKNAESSLAEDFRRIDKISLLNTDKVLEAFREERIAVRHFAATNGYGYG